MESAAKDASGSPEKPVYCQGRMSAPLPSFERPPVERVEIAFVIERSSASIRDLFEFYSAHLADAYPDMHEHPAVEPEQETPWGESPRITIDLQRLMQQARPSIQLHARSKPHQWDLRLQRDWVCLRWIRGTDQVPYPRWNAVHDRAARILQAFLDEFGGEIVGVEVEYFNLIPEAAACEIVASPFAGESLGPIESLQMHSHHQLTINEAKARLHLDVGPPDNPSAEGLHLALTVRGRPSEPDITTALDFADRAREKIVTGFTDVTPPDFHEEWGKEQP